MTDPTCTDHELDEELTSYSATVTGATFDAPGDELGVEFTVEASWGAYDASHGVQLSIMVRELDGQPTDHVLSELPLDRAEELARDLLAAVEARRAHPPTTAELILAAYHDRIYRDDREFGAWLSLAELRADERLAALPAGHVDAALAEMFEADAIELDTTTADPAEDAAGIELDGVWRTRIREHCVDEIAEETLELQTAEEAAAFIEADAAERGEWINTRTCPHCRQTRVAGHTTTHHCEALDGRAVDYHDMHPGRRRVGVQTNHQEQ